MNATSTTILVIHDDAVVAAGLAALLRSCPDFDVRLPGTAPGPARFSGSTDAVDAVDVLDVVDVVVADYLGGIGWMTAAAGHQAQARSRAQVLIVAPAQCEWEVQYALRVGVRGYFLQGGATDELIHGVRTVAAGSRFLSRSVAQCIAEGMTHEPLTLRERQVLGFLVEGLCNKSIARELGIALGTVKSHVKSILDKLGATTRTHAVAVATRRGLFSRMETSRREPPVALLRSRPGPEHRPLAAAA